MSTSPPIVSGAGGAASAGVLGDGSDGAFTFDGVTTPGFATLAGSIYSLTRDVFLTTGTVNSGVTVKPSNFRIFCTGTLVNNGTISANGNPAVGSTAGTNLGNGVYLGGRGGGAGGTGVSGTGGNGGGITLGSGGGGGGAGTSGAAGIGGLITGPNIAQATPLLRTPTAAQAAQFSFNNTNQQLQFGCGGGGGGSDASSNAGGGGGGGAGMVVIFAGALVNNGSLSATGGAGAAGAAGNAGGGGGGAGGAVLTYTASAPSGTGTTSAAGGALGAGVGTGSPGVAGGNGLVLQVTL